MIFEQVYQTHSMGKEYFLKKCWDYQFTPPSQVTLHTTHENNKQKFWINDQNIISKSTEGNSSSTGTHNTNSTGNKRKTEIRPYQKNKTGNL